VKKMKTGNLVKTTLVFVAVLFGAMTLFAGIRVLTGADPGYVVFRPLLLYNTLMGVAYVAAGAIAWRNPAAGMRVAGIIFALNAAVLLAVVYLYRTGSAVAIDSVQAMTLRSVVWLVLLAGFAWLSRAARPAAPGQE